MPFVLLGDSLPASCVKWKIKLGSTSPLRVAPGKPERGVRPILVPTDLPAWMQHAEQPEPRCRAMMFSCSTGLERKVAVAREMKA